MGSAGSISLTGKSDDEIDTFLKTMLGDAADGGGKKSESTTTATEVEQVAKLTAPKLRHNMRHSIRVSARNLMETAEKDAEELLGFQQTFPMLVMPMSKFLELSTMRTCEDLLEAGDGSLVLYKPGMVVHFLSHQWLSFQHPDPDGVQLRCMQSVFRSVLDGRPISELFIDQAVFDKVFCHVA